MAMYLLLYLMPFSLDFFFLSSIMQGFCFTIYFILFFPQACTAAPYLLSHKSYLKEEKSKLPKSCVPHAPLKTEAD